MLHRFKIKRLKVGKLFTGGYDPFLLPYRSLISQHQSACIE